MSQIQQLYDANGNPVDMSMFYTQPPNQGQLPTYTETKSQTVQQVQTQQVSGQPIQQAQQKSYQPAQQTYQQVPEQQVPVQQVPIQQVPIQTVYQQVPVQTVYQQPVQYVPVETRKSPRYDDRYDDRYDPRYDPRYTTNNSRNTTTSSAYGSIPSVGKTMLGVAGGVLAANAVSNLVGGGRRKQTVVVTPGRSRNIRISRK